MVKHVSTHDTLGIGENTALLHAIFPRYPDLLGMKPAPEVSIYLLAKLGLRSQSSQGVREKGLSLRFDDN